MLTTHPQMDPLPEWQAASPIQRDAGSVMEQGIAQMKRDNMVVYPFLIF